MPADTLPPTTATVTGCPAAGDTSAPSLMLMVIRSPCTNLLTCHQFVHEPLKPCCVPKVASPLGQHLFADYEPPCI